jgi:hypothetical protein
MIQATRYVFFVTVLAAFILGVACSKKVMVPVPPRVDLETYQTIGMMEFSSNAEGDLHLFASQKFLQSIQACQPGVRVLELGSTERVLASVGKRDLNYEAVRAIGKKYDVDAVIAGRMDVTDIKPKVDLYSIIQSMSISADVEASLTTRLYDASGVTLWTSRIYGNGRLSRTLRAAVIPPHSASRAAAWVLGFNWHCVI